MTVIGKSEWEEEENAVLAIMVVARLSGDAAIVNALQCPPGHGVQNRNFIEFGPPCWTQNKTVLLSS